MKSIIEVNTLIGKNLDEGKTIATNAGFITRLVNVDGTPQICTRDRRLDRINLTIESNIIKNAHIG